MNKIKLSPLPILICGVAIALIALFYGLFMQAIPNNREADGLVKNTEMQNAEAAKQGQAEKRVKRAIADITAKDKAWQVVVATRTPSNKLSTGGIDLSVNAYQLGIDTDVFRDNIQRAVNAQLRKGGVKVLGAPTIQMLDPNGKVGSILSDFYNYPAIPFPIVMFDFGTITVQGSYKQIMDHLRAYKSMPNYLAVSDGLTLTGTSPMLTATYNLSVIGFIRAKHIYPSVPEGAASSSAGFGGGGPGGSFPGGAFPGGPGGPPGGPGGLRKGPGGAGGGIPSAPGRPGGGGK